MAGVNFLLLSIFVNLVILAAFTEAWTANACSTVKSRRVRYRYCRYRNWAGSCCAWGTSTRTEWYTERYCCTGWTHNGNQVCNIPICSPNCFYGGTCIRPNQCDCPDGRKGRFCRESQCESYIKPCYPGYCDMSDTCQCVNGYSGPSCLTFSAPELVPFIEKCQTRFSYYHNVKKMIVYSYYTDATGKSTTEVVWTNQPIFNRLQFSFEASFDTKYTIPLHVVSLPPQPNYIRTFRIGIVEAKVYMTHYTYQLGSLKHDETFTCAEVSRDNPMRDQVLNCTLKKDAYTSSIETGDVFTFTFTAKSGGFRDLLNRDTGAVTKREYYNGRTTNKVMQFRVDRDNPKHCQENNACSSGEQSLYVVQDITKSEIETRWSGWKDDLSGIVRYAWEIFKMRPDHNGHLTEFDDPDPNTNAVVPPVPLENTGINDSVAITEYDYSFTPNDPGMYSIVLEAADAANNTRYARRLVLYDPSSTVTINDDPNYKMYASTASVETGNIWQKTINKSGKTSVTVVWPNHFHNKVHENGKFLNRVLGFKSYLDDGDSRINYKFINPDSGFDDHEGARTKAEISNFHGIVRFEIADDYDETGGSTISNRGLTWRNVSTFNESDTIERSNVNDGGTMKVYVRATDVMGNTNIDSILIHFDSTDPVISTPTIKKNIQGGAFPFSSSITVRTEDRDSGVFELKYKFIADDTKMVKHTGSVRFPKRTEAECRNMPCYQINMGDYFPYEMSFDINHCWLMVPKEKLDSQVINLEIESVNPAMLSSKATLQLINIRGYDGIEAYFPPINVTVQTKTDTGISITWSHAATCHERTKILVTLVQSNGEVKEYPVHKDATSFDLTGLDPETTYSIMIYNMFGDIQSEASAVVKATTAEYKGLKTGGIAGVVIGVILGIILIVLLVSVICWRTNRMPEPIHRVVDRPFSVIFKPESKDNDYIDHANSMKATRKPRKQVYSTNLDNIDEVYYMEGEYNKSTGGRIPRRQITLEQEIARGRFAVIYKAKYSRGGNDAETVVAKVLHEKFTKDDQSFMNAKIYFMTEVVGSHPNILKIIGAVDDQALGPMMILEYCETGTLKDYLRARKERVDENVMEKLFRFSFDICKGMEHLASKKIVHRKLAARNVLLTFTLEVKITGFGPMAEDTNADADKDKKEMLPIKWIAPECILDGKTATEKSDIWSYGVTLWEIFSLGEAPYSNIRSKEIHSRLMQGERLSKPEHCDDTFHGIMKRCWNKEPKKRPNFKKLRSEIEQLFVTGPNDDYYYEQGHLYDNRQ